METTFSRRQGSCVRVPESELHPYKHWCLLRAPTVSRSIPQSLEIFTPFGHSIGSAGTAVGDMIAFPQAYAVCDGTVGEEHRRFCCLVAGCFLCRTLA